MKPSTLWLILAGILILAAAIYQSRRSNRELDIDPAAARQIEKAQRQ